MIDNEKCCACEECTCENCTCTEDKPCECSIIRGEEYYARSNESL